MKTLNLLTSACRFCRHYKSEGRRGGVCQILEVPVKGSWKACSLAIPTFTTSWDIEGIILSDETSTLPSRPLVAAIDISPLEACEKKVNGTSEWKKAEPVLV